MTGEHAGSTQRSSTSVSRKRRRPAERHVSDFAFVALSHDPVLAGCLPQGNSSLRTADSSDGQHESRECIAPKFIWDSRAATAGESSSTRHVAKTQQTHANVKHRVTTLKSRRKSSCELSPYALKEQTQSALSTHRSQTSRGLKKVLATSMSTSVTAHIHKPACDDEDFEKTLLRSGGSTTSSAVSR
eukprot:13466-Heterococcus_DN1.PRE.4